VTQHRGHVQGGFFDPNDRDVRNLFGCVKEGVRKAGQQNHIIPFLVGLAHQLQSRWPGKGLIPLRRDLAPLTRFNIGGLRLS